MSANSPDAGKPASPPIERLPTRLESADEIREAIAARRPAKAAPPPDARLPGPVFVPGPPPAPPPAVAAAPTLPPPAGEVPLFCPSNRPPVAILYVLDDGDDNGQRIRVRGDRFVIGRTEGDLRLPHDPQISGRHAELLRQKNDDGWQWLLTDLSSTNGTFVRVGGAVLKNDQELIVGRTRYRFDTGQVDSAATSAIPVDPGSPTAPWNAPADQPSAPALVEETPAGPGARIPLRKSEYWIGSDGAACAIVPPSDPFVNARHAKLLRDDKGRWHITNNKSVNGIWLRIEQMPLTSSCQFQLGEQRFILKVP